MREVKEKSPLKERVGETLKSAPRTAFRRGTDASFQQLRQELREAAQDGQSEDRYESGKITDTADHAVELSKRLCRHIYYEYPQLVGGFVHMYRALFEEKEDEDGIGDD